MFVTDLNREKACKIGFWTGKKLNIERLNDNKVNTILFCEINRVEKHFFDWKWHENDDEKMKNDEELMP